jgi:peptidoglycan/xylan/chitin deacetylase (PgdA/CDA1 family)
MHNVILTFDDGPHPEHTPRVLDSLAKEHVQAIFFVCGERLVRPGPLAVLQRAAREGHLIGNHTFSHRQLTGLTADEVRLEILKTHELIAELEPTQKLFRPPYGAHNEMVDSIVEQLGYRTVFWNVDPEDWRQADQPSKWVDIAIKQISVRDKALCLCHDIHSRTVDHLDEFLSRVKQLPGARFVKYTPA